MKEQEPHTMVDLSNGVRDIIRETCYFGMGGTRVPSAAAVAAGTALGTVGGRVKFPTPNNGKVVRVGAS